MYSRNLRYWLDKWPGKKTLGVYRFLPLFFILGATLEFSMISVRIGTTNFYSTFNQKQAEKIARRRLGLED